MRLQDWRAIYGPDAPCPECGAVGQTEDNGDVQDFTLLCEECGHQWNPRRPCCAEFLTGSDEHDDDCPESYDL